MHMDDMGSLACDVCVVGGGSGGIGAALAASREGASVVLLEREAQLGGTAVHAGVQSWEPGVGGTGLPREIYYQLAQIAQAAAIQSLRAPYSAGHPYAEWRHDPARTYGDTLWRAGFPYALCHSITFEPEAYLKVVGQMLAATDRWRVLCQSPFVEAKAQDRRLVSLTAERDGRRFEVVAKVFIDCTADVHLCRAAGCETMLGEDSRERFGEPDAPERPSRRVNGVSMIYRIRRTGQSQVEPLPPGVAPGSWKRPAHTTEFACGDRLFNVLPTMEGQEFLEAGYERGLEECRRRAAAHWHWMQMEHGFADWRRVWIAPRPGVRETHRVVGEYVLREQDLLAGLAGQGHEDIIATADHAMDIHGQGGGCRELPGPYGVPYRCLIPKGWRNLLVACRGASFSHISASSCRLSRTMMQLGQAAGIAAVLAAQDGREVGAVDVARLRRRLSEEGVRLMAT